MRPSGSTSVIFVLPVQLSIALRIAELEFTMEFGLTPKLATDKETRIIFFKISVLLNFTIN
jgi:hypothetical protein